MVRGSSSEFYGRREVYVNSMIPKTAVTVKILMPFTSFIDKRERKVQDDILQSCILACMQLAQ